MADIPLLKAPVVLSELAGADVAADGHVPMADGAGSVAWRTPGARLSYPTTGAIGSVGIPGSTLTPGNGWMFLSPIRIDRAVTVSAIGIYVSGAGSAGAVIRFGIYEMGSDGAPGALVVDAGAADATTTGYKSVAGAHPLEPAWYYVASVVQGAPTTRPTMYFLKPLNLIANTLGGANQAQYGVGGYRLDGTTGALPASATAAGPSDITANSVLEL